MWGDGAGADGGRTGVRGGFKLVDKTGLTGEYDFLLQWTPDYAANADSQWPALSVAIEEQLGLKLLPRKGMQQTLLIEHVERPTQN